MKVLFLFWHGLGDNILATPAIKAYKKANPDHYIGWAMLRRFKSAQLWNPYIDEYHWVDDAWNDYKTYKEGSKKVIEQAEIIADSSWGGHGYDKLIVIDHKSSGKHKIYRNADEMGITVTDLKTEFYFQFPRAMPMWDYDFFHGKSGVQTKDMMLFDVQRIYGTIKNPLLNADVNKPLWYWAEFLAQAKNIYVVDSVYFHIACALGRKPDVAYFAKGKPIFDVVKPLHMDVSNSVIYQL